jgi:hypothetical protein
MIARKVSFLEYVRLSKKMDHQEARRRLEQLGWHRALIKHHKENVLSPLKYTQVCDIRRAFRVEKKKYRRMCKAYFGESL